MLRYQFAIQILCIQYDAPKVQYCLVYNRFLYQNLERTLLKFHSTMLERHHAMLSLVGHCQVEGGKVFFDFHPQLSQLSDNLDFILNLGWMRLLLCELRTKELSSPLLVLTEFYQQRSTPPCNTIHGGRILRLKCKIIFHHNFCKHLVSL